MKSDRIVVVDTLEQMCDLMCGKPEDEHEYCLRCGRRLKSQEARMLGYGTVCYKKMQSQKSVPRLFSLHSGKNKV